MLHPVLFLYVSVLSPIKWTHSNLPGKGETQIRGPPRCSTLGQAQKIGDGEAGGREAGLVGSMPSPPLTLEPPEAGTTSSTLPVVSSEPS